MRTEEFYAFMRERESIRLKKAAGQPPPWTDDPILHDFKFTNVKREHDRTSRWLIDNLYAKHPIKGLDSAPRIVALFNAALYRYFGTIEWAEAIGWQPQYDPKALLKQAKAMRRLGQKMFTGAYIVTSGGRGGPKYEYVIKRVLKDVWLQASLVVASAASNWSWEDAVTALKEVEGFSSFMAKEVILDTRYVPGWWPKGAPVDVNTYTPIGPGARRGAARVMDIWPKLPTEAEALEVCKALFAEREKCWPKGWVELELHDVQFQLCEADKHERTRLGEGRPRSRYVWKGEGE